MKRLTQSLEAAQKALTELRTHAGRNSAQSTRTLHRDLGKFVSSAKRDSGKFATALKKDFEQAQKTITSAASSRSGSASRSTRGRSASRTTSKRSTRKTS